MNRLENKISTHTDDDDELSAAESEEIEQLLLNYKKNQPKKRTSSKKIDPIGSKIEIGDRCVDINNTRGTTDEIVVVSIEHYGDADDETVNENSNNDNFLETENECTSSSSFLHDLLPHLSESNTAMNFMPSPCQSTTPILSKTYTEPTSLSGLLRQMSTRLFSHPKIQRRHSRISPTASIREKLNDSERDLQAPTASSSQATMLTIAAVDSTPPALETTVGCQTSFSSLSSPMKLENQRRVSVKASLCKRCPHCRKTCLLRTLNEKHSDFVHSSMPTATSNACACRICTLLENVESNLSSPNSDSQKLFGSVTNDFPTSSTTVDFSSNDYPAPGTGFEVGDVSGVELNDDEKRRESLSGLSALEFGLFCDECNNIGSHEFHRDSLTRINEISVCKAPSNVQQQLQQPQQPRKSREQGIQVNSSSMVSIATTSSFGGPVCRICHSPGDKLEPLISPCRCLGTLKFVHAACLLHWLDISSRKLRRPPHCELCGYRYQRHKTMKLRRIQWPGCNRRDKLYHVLFLLSVMIMIACAAVTVVCFKTDRGQPRTTTTTTADDGIVVKKATANGGTAAVGGSNGSNHVELSGQEVVTLICGILFFCAFFVAMYVQVKAQTTIYKLFVRFWSMNQEWRVDEYRKEKDQEYWRQRYEQQQLQLQQKRQINAQLSNAITSVSENGNAVGDSGSMSPAPNRVTQQPRPSYSLSPSSSASFRAEAFHGID